MKRRLSDSIFALSVSECRLMWFPAVFQGNMTTDEWNVSILAVFMLLCLSRQTLLE